jgi:7,8-dihydroneopterin aldolase/epimerase/oxygenase
MMTNDCIHIRGIELPVRIGVPDEERAAWQTLQADVRVGLVTGFDSMPDELTATVDYDALTRGIKALAAERPRLLLETLAAEILTLVFRDPKIQSVCVELRKRILPGVDHVAVSMERRRA